MSLMKKHTDLDVWKKSIDLVEEVYLICSKFPQSEIYGLTSQMKRSAISIPSNIAEGSARQTDKEFIQFLYIALGSANELDTQLIIANRLNFLTTDTTNIYTNIQNIKKMLLGLIKYIKDKSNAR